MQVLNITDKYASTGSLPARAPRTKHSIVEEEDGGGRSEPSFAALARYFADPKLASVAE
jgi:hypothetical protein